MVGIESLPFRFDQATNSEVSPKVEQPLVAGASIEVFLHGGGDGADVFGAGAAAAADDACIIGGYCPHLFACATPGQGGECDDGEPCEEKGRRRMAELKQLPAEAARLDEVIGANPGDIGCGA